MPLENILPAGMVTAMQLMVFFMMENEEKMIITLGFCDSIMGCSCRWSLRSRTHAFAHSWRAIHCCSWGTGREAHVEPTLAERREEEQQAGLHYYYQLAHELLHCAIHSAVLHHR